MPKKPPAKMIIRADVVKQLGFTVDQLADMTGVSPSTVKRTLAGQDPSTAFLAGLWTRLGLSPDRVTQPIDPLRPPPPRRARPPN
jgi:transcriptional regulator with XRE-family HTH domain